MILKLIPNTHPILHERVKPCSEDLDRREISRIEREYGSLRRDWTVCKSNWD